MTPGTQANAVLSHGQVEAALKALAIRQITSLWGRTVFRLSLFHWSVAGGPPKLLLPAIDSLMRSRLAIRTEPGQDSGNDSSAEGN
jgi:hypothetical protein